MKTRKELSESDNHKEILSLEILIENSPNIVDELMLHATQGWVWYLKHVLKSNFWKVYWGKKLYHLIGDFNINYVKYFENAKVSTFYNSLFQYGAIALINEPTQCNSSFMNKIGVCSALSCLIYGEERGRKNSTFGQTSPPISPYYVPFLKELDLKKTLSFKHLEKFHQPTRAIKRCPKKISLSLISGTGSICY